MGGHDHGSKKKKPASTGKKIAFFSIGSITLLYCIAELAVAIYINSLTLLSDGFHNLSDVVSLYIAYWAQNAAQRDQSDDMSYGWGRTEILGGLSNGCFLLSLCLYVTLEAIPKIIHPEALGLDCSGPVGCERVYELFILIAVVGVLVNTTGTIVFAFAGLSHGHSHSHGHGHGHGHGHSHGETKKKKTNKHKNIKGGDKREAAALLGNVNFDGSEYEGSESESEHEGHDHGHGHDHEHSHDSGHKHKHGKKDKKEKKEKKEHKHDHGGHDHGHDHGHGHEHEHGHGKKDKAHKHEKEGYKPMKEKKHKKKKGGLFANMDMNMGAVFIHYLGDTVSSLVVLGTGILLHYFHSTWALYIDPVSSLVIVVLIVASTVPLVKRCSKILLQGVPEGVDVEVVRSDVADVDHIVSIHDLHIWQLVDGMVIASVHLLVEEGGNLGDVLYHVKRIFHEHGIHSSSIQPEFVPATTSKNANFCAQNCVEDCEEDWCCKNTAERHEQANLVAIVV